MAEKVVAPNFQALEDTYQILGELRGSRDARKYVAKRRDDGTDVVITVATPPTGGESNELSHWAADVQLLANLRHDSVARVFETRWLDNRTLAVASERVPWPTLDEALEHQERFTNPRIAVILQEVHGALQWAREQGLVHRGVTPDNVYFEPGTERIVVALSATPIPMTGPADACRDAQTIGRLAWAMLTGTPYEDAEGSPPLRELAPNLAERVIDATEEMVRCKLGDETPDILTFLGIIAAGDVLKQAEVEIAAMKEQYDEEHQAELAKCEAHRLEVEQHAAEEAARLAKEREETEARLAAQITQLSDERADFERIMMERQEQLTKIRAELETQGGELERRLAEFDTRRKEFERFRMEEQSKLTEMRRLYEMARASAKAGIPRPSDAAGLAAIAATADAAAAESVVPEELADFEGADFAMADEDEKTHRKPQEIKTIFAPLDKPLDMDAKKPSRRKWMVPAGVGAVVLAAVGAFAGIRQMNSAPTANKVTIGKSVIVPTPPRLEDNAYNLRAGFLRQKTAGGMVAPRPLMAPAPTPQATDSAVTGQLPVADTTSAVTPSPQRVAPRPRPRPRAVDPSTDPTNRDLTVRPPATSPFSLPPRDTAVNMVRDTALLRPDTIARRDSLRRDSLARRDTTRRPDSIRVRPDTGRPPG
jgi:flagellar biosynthesis GTPase FlhF